MSDSIKKMIAQTFEDIASGLETGSFGGSPKIALTALGSELGEDNGLEGAILAANKGIDVTLIGTKEDERITTAKVANEDESHDKMDELLGSGAVDAAVTMHYPFPIGVSTVGRIIAPGTGKQVFIATTTGTSSPDRIEAMSKNAIYGIIAAKSCGIKRPTVGILNVDGARQTEGILKEIQKNGYDFDFASSGRADGGCVMRGNDILTGSCDVMVTDSLTGNILMKLLSAGQTGGSYEASGFGYGPGVGPNQDKLVMIISRASGAPVVAGAIEYAADLVRGGYHTIRKAEFEAANKAGLQRILDERKAKAAEAAGTVKETVSAPPKEIVTEEIAGIEIMDLEDAVESLWKASIYAESGMGCTGPVILVNDEKHEEAMKILIKDGWVTE